MTKKVTRFLLNYIEQNIGSWVILCVGSIYSFITGYSGYNLFKKVGCTMSIYLYLLLWAVSLITFVVVVIALKTKIAYVKYERMLRKKDRANNYVETWVELEFSNNSLRVVNKKNIYGVERGDNGYLVHLDNLYKKDIEIMADLLINFISPLDISMCDIDIIKIKGNKKASFHIIHKLNPTSIIGSNYASIFCRVANLDINEGVYRIIFNSKQH